MRAPAADNVVAVIVTMDPENDVLRHAETLVGLGVRTLVVDNGSGPDSAPLLDTMAALAGVDLIRNPANLGIARALNQGAEKAHEAGAAWLLTLDQDAAPGPEIVQVAASTFASFPLPDRIAVIGSSSEVDAARAAATSGPDRPWAEVKTAITAGSFVSLDAMRALGGYRDDLFVDYVDIEFCLRAHAGGYRLVTSLTPTMTHRVGEPSQRRLGPRLVRPTNHSALRRYYITRNRFIVWRRYCRTEIRFVARDVFACQKEMVKLLLFEEDRPAKVRAMLSGLRDGLRNATGEKGVSRG
jgi:rhamnosyltransferase